MVYIDPRVAAKVQARKQAVFKAEQERKFKANLEAMAVVAKAGGIRKGQG